MREKTKHSIGNGSPHNIIHIPAMNEEAYAVVGSTHGIGKALVEELLRKMKIVYGCASSAVDQRGNEMEKRWPGRYKHFICDVSDEQAVMRFFAEIAKSGVTLRKIINCAGIGFAPRNAVDFRAEEGKRVLEVNTLGTAYVLKYGLPVLIREGGAFLVCGSIAADQADTGADAMYGASKAALRPLLRQAAAEKEHIGMAFLYAKLGYIRTRMTAADDPEKWRVHTQYGEPGTPEETAKLLLLAAENSKPGYNELIIIGGGYRYQPMTVLGKKGPARSAVMLLPVTSLPNDYSCGTLGPEAYKAVDELEAAGFRAWMMLPLNPTGFSNSPYSSYSSMGGSINLISPALLLRDGLLSQDEHDELVHPTRFTDYGDLYTTRVSMIRWAHRRFRDMNHPELTAQFQQFCTENAFWLDDLAVYMSAKYRWCGRAWQEWPDEALKAHDPEAIAAYRRAYRDDVEAMAFSQFLFYKRQLAELRRYANVHGVRLIGDLPFYVCPDSVDVWANRELFRVDDSGRVLEYGGVPNRNAPDTNWGNPCCDWERQRADGFAWWRRRIRFFAEVYDVLRIDHAVGMRHCYSIPSDGTAGSWRPGPDVDGMFSQMIANEAGRFGTDVIMEDLGEVPPGLRERIADLGFCGMRVLQYAYSNKYFSRSSHLPMYMDDKTACFTGTHDNQPLKDYLADKSCQELDYMMYMLNVTRKEDLHWAVIRDAYNSPARYSVIPIQDVLGLDTESCMVNRKHLEKAWLWRMESFEKLHSLCGRLRAMAILSGRKDADQEESMEALDIMREVFNA